MNREPKKQPENVSPESTNRDMGPAEHTESEKQGGRWAGNLSHMQSDSHTDPAIPIAGEPEDDNAELDKVDPHERTRRYRDAA